MPLQLPEGRQFQCVLLTPDDGWALRELIKPYDAAPERLEAQIALCKRVYEALLRMIVADLPFFNLPVSVDECLLINQLLKSGAYKTADALLLQTWQVLHEWNYDEPFRPAPVAFLFPAIVLEVEEVEDALHQAGGSGRAEHSDPGTSKEDYDAGRAELRLDVGSAGGGEAAA